jgi:hypothetical protein
MMPWAVLVIFILFLVLAYIIIQGTRAALAWRQAAERGDVKVIRDILEESLKAWSAQKRPKPIAAEVWRGIQALQLVAVGPDFVRVSTRAESEYRLVNDQWVEMTNPLQEGMGITAKAAEMLFYDLGYLRPNRIQIDVYTQYRDEIGVTQRECVLSTFATREAAKDIDWDEWTADEIVSAMGGVFRLSETGRPLPIAPLDPPADALPPPEPEDGGGDAVRAHSSDGPEATA